MVMDSLLRILSRSFFPSSSSFSPFEPDKQETFSTVANANSATPKSVAATIPNSSNPKKTHLSPFQAECNFGILVALPEESGTQNPKVVHRKPFQKYRSVPVNVPSMQRREFEEEEDEEGNGEMMLAPHEIVDRARRREESLAASSVMEGVGRKLKGSDQRRFRNAVFQETGFLDGFV